MTITMLTFLVAALSATQLTAAFPTTTTTPVTTQTTTTDVSRTEPLIELPTAQEKRKPCPKRKEKILPPTSFYAVRRLYSEHKFVIMIDRKGAVRGTTDIYSRYALMKIETAGLNGLFRAKAIATNLYLSMDSRGRLYTTRNRTEENVFRKKDSPSHGWFTYESYKYCDMYIGFKRNHHPRLGFKVKPGKHTAHFLEI
uniref:Fibroblast growth factor a2 n=1 Tax=Nematostella vectensis TaxID=45351 RepID=A7YAZ0_NEMVE|nr:fibroblast growth factor a2 [Nematostella vectensis]